MTEEEARAARIRQLKDERPDLTWRFIGDAVGVSERNAWSWSKTGRISYPNAKRLAEAFGVNSAWLWAGDPAAPVENDQMARIEDKLDRQYEILGDIFRALGGEPGWQERISRAGRELAELGRDTSPDPRARPTGTNGLGDRPADG